MSEHKSCQRCGATGLAKNPVATLADAGIDKNLAHQARTLGALSDSDFEAVVADARDKVARAIRNAVGEIEQERESYAARIEQGGDVGDLIAMAEDGRRFKVIYGDPAWKFKVYSGKGKQRSADRDYDTSSLDAIKALPIGELAADDCALFLWGVWPELPGALEVIKAWGFKYKTTAFVWVKNTPKAELIKLDGGGLRWGMGYWTRANTEFCLLATKGASLRLSEDVHQVVIAPAIEHSVKPEEARARIERLLVGPYLEIFARRPVPKWTVWGNEMAYDAADDFKRPIDGCYAAVRKRVAAGGEKWKPR